MPFRSILPGWKDIAQRQSRVSNDHVSNDQWRNSGNWRMASRTSLFPGHVAPRAGRFMDLVRLH